MTEWEESITELFIVPFAKQIIYHSKTSVISTRPEVKPELVEPDISWMMKV